MSGTPSIQITTSGGVTDAVTTALSGTASGLSFGAVSVYDNGVYVGSAGVYGGNWSVTIAPSQGDNSYTATGLAQTDPGVSSAAVVLTDVRTSPTVAVAQAGGNTDAVTQTLSGTTTTAGYGARFTAGTALTLSDDGTVVGHATVAADGTWASQITLAATGNNFVTVSDTDLAGNTGAADVLFALKTSVPAIAITSAGGAVSQPVQVITGTATAGDAGDAITVSEDGTAIGTAAVGTDGTWALTTTLSAGPHTFQATDADPYGNVGTSNAVSYVYGAPPSTPPAPAAPSPSVSITSPGGLTNQPAATVSGQAAANSAVTLYDDGSAITSTTAAADGSWRLALTLAQGVDILSATDTTAAGTVGSDAIATILDTTPPAVAFGAAPQLSGTTATLTGTASDASGIAGVEIYDGSTDLGAAQLGGDGTWTFSHDFGQGSYDHLAAVATDAAGNGAGAMAPFDLDTGVTGRRYLGKVTTTDASGAVTGVTTTAADGSTGSQTVRNSDGTATSTAFENGQALFSIGGDVMTGGGMRENFVFQPTMGHARITDFVVDGRGHDTLTLSRQDFADIAQVLARTTMSGGAAVIHVTPEDTIRLAGVTRAQLAANRTDFAFAG